ncbi:vacuolar sorting protein VPS33/slp1 [Tulasnella sp. 419]|nr:vacuolar sorting protein VPS33/slp1 [Tulasnella sp. 419]
MISLIETVRKRFLDAIRSVNPPGRWKVVVIDEHAQKLLGAVMKNYDVLQENVTLVESISSHRQPQPGMEAMYLLMPTTKNVDRIIHDFSGAETIYDGAHLFFMDPLPDALFTRLMSSPAEPFMRQLSDLYVNYRAIEAQVFSVHAPHQFFSFYSPPPSMSAIASARARIEEDLLFTAKGILNVIVSLGDNPLIRYYIPEHPPLGALADQAQPARATPSEGSGRWRGALASSSRDSAGDLANRGEYVSKKLAFMVQHELDEYIKANPDYVKTEAPGKPRTILFITERTMDMAAPFLHEFTYQAMANDLLRIENGTHYRYKFQSAVGTYEDKTAVLSDADNVWTEIRHLHMQETINKLMQDFNKFLEEHAGFNSNEGATSVNDMKDMLASLPQFQEQREKFSLHINMAQECMDIFAKRKLTDVASVEQNCATGETPEGKTPKTLVEEMVPLLDDSALSNKDKVRIIALYVMYRQGVPDEDRRRLFEHARLMLSEQDALNALALLGVRVTRVPGDKDRKMMKQKPADDDYDLSRFQPLLKTVLMDHVADKLDADRFPYVRNAPPPAAASASARPVQAATSLRSAKPGWAKATKPGVGRNEVRQRFLVFIAGGMTYSEMRTAYQLSESLKKEIIIGSSHIYTPEQFIEDLKALQNGGVGSKALPNGLQSVENRNGEPRSYQMAYDQKYFTKDPPPPPRPATAPIQQPNHHSQSTPGRSGGLAPPLASPAQSSLSLRSSHSGVGEVKEKKKKRHFFGL